MTGSAIIGAENPTPLSSFLMRPGGDVRRLLEEGYSGRLRSNCRPEHLGWRYPDA
jgi:hypothetical protein